MEIITGAVGIALGLGMGLVGWTPSGVALVLAMAGLLICPWISLLEILFLAGRHNIPDSPREIVRVNIGEWLMFIVFATLASLVV